MNEDNFNMAVRKFLKEVGITSQREIERIVREGKVEGSKLIARHEARAISVIVSRHLHFDIGLVGAPLAPAKDAGFRPAREQAVSPPLWTKRPSPND